ncbi:response regulator [Aquincola sp. S2]|uniref:histidine kinase n=1 Tax=Pseudaquabacterium terrae TaxID=2732868 RepID=A0ABX2ELQ4_9BURK|nr:ATP-binding protein [Aquabacterium terrae]NRF69587.1 response regulator [Aquabacterium terrae]
MLTRLSIRVKVLLAPLVVMLLCVAVSAGSIALLRAQGAAFRDVIGGAFDTAITSSRVSLAVAGLQSDLIRHIDLSGRQPDAEAITELRASLPRRLDQVEAMLQSIETNATSIEPDLLHATRELLAVYRVVATRIVSASQGPQGNPMQVSSLMAHYSQLDAYLGRLSEISVRAARERQARTESFVARSVDVMLAAVTASLVLGLIATWLIGRAIATPLTDMTAVMQRLAQGEYDIRVPAMERRDEVGSMAAAVEVFRLASLQLQQHEAELAQMVEHLAVMRDQAAEASRAKSDFLASMSHELRTPLNAILGYAQILQWDAGLTPRQTTGLATIEQAGQHLLGLIDEILDLAKVESGKVDLHATPVELLPFLQGIVNIVRVRVEQKGVAFEFVTEGALPHAVMVDERRLRQVLLNLLGNAAKFTDAGSVRLLVRTDAAGDEPAGTTLRFEVHDSGIGISAADLALLFQPFQQVGEQQRRRGGTGLGLAISRQLVRHMGGDIAVRSMPGEGSCFSFALRLPVLAVPALPAAPRIVTGYEGPRKTILVVDDVAQNRNVLTDMLRPLGFRVEEAGDGEEGLAQAVTLRPDIVLMDNVMPVLDGLEATRRLRRLPGLERVPVIAISASAAGDGEARALDAGADAFLTKPFRADELLTLLARYLGITLVQR